MKSKTTLLFVILLAIAHNISAQVYMFQKAYGGSGTEYCYSIQQTSDGGYVFAGETDTYGAGYYDGYIVKTNEQGVIAWAKSYGDTAWDWLNSIRQTSDGGYIATGGTQSSSNGFGDIWILKTNASGAVQWQKTVGGVGYDNGYDVRQTTDGGFIICGLQNDDINANDNACLIKTDASGNVTWIKTYSIGADEYAYTVEQTPDGGYILGGESYYSPGDVALVIKTDATGTQQWARTYGGGTDYWVTRIILAGNGDYFVAGTASQPTYLNVWLARLSSSGVPVWSNTYAGSGALEDNCIWATRTSDGGFALCGGTNSFTADYESFLLKTDSTGGPEWTKRYGGSGNDNSSQVIETAWGGYILGSNTLSFGTGASAYLIKTNAGGNSMCNENIAAFIANNVTTASSIVTVTVSTVTNSATASFGSSVEVFNENQLCLTVGTDEMTDGGNGIAIYPNPASDELRVQSSKFEVQSVEVYDVLGKRVYSVQATKGKQETINVSGWNAGMYFVKVRGEKSETVFKLMKE